MNAQPPDGVGFRSGANYRWGRVNLRLPANARA
jgi:hypothetical protein